MDLKLAIFRPLLKQAMEKHGPGAALGFELTKVRRGEIAMTFPYIEEWAGNPTPVVIPGSCPAS